VREVCALWFLARKRRGAAVGAEGRKPEEEGESFGSLVLFLGGRFLVCLLQGKRGRTALLGFFQGQGGAAVEKIDFRFFLYPWGPPKIFSTVNEFFSPCKFLCSMIFIGKVLLGFQTSPSTFPFLFFSCFFFFVNFDFSHFFCIFESEQFQRQLNKENQ